MFYTILILDPQSPLGCTEVHINPISHDININKKKYLTVCQTVLLKRRGRIFSFSVKKNNVRNGCGVNWFLTYSFSLLTTKLRGLRKRQKFFHAISMISLHWMLRFFFLFGGYPCDQLCRCQEWQKTIERILRIRNFKISIKVRQSIKLFFGRTTLGNKKPSCG